MRSPRLLVALLAGTLVCSVPGNSAWAAEADRQAAATEAMLRAESLGELRLGMSEKAVLKLLGKPEKQGALIYQGADGSYVQEWSYARKGIEITMTSGEKKTGAKTIAHFMAGAPCPYATRKGIQIGSPEAAVKKAYGAYADRDFPAEPGVFVAGSVYGGIIFNFSKGKVSRIFFGAAAE